MRNIKSYTLQNKIKFREQLLSFSSRYNHFCFLDSCNNNVYGEPSFDFLLAAGNYRSVELNSPDVFIDFKRFINNNNDWCFGFMSYDLKNEIENLQSNNPDHIGFADAIFFIPEIIVRVKLDKVEISIVAYNSLWNECDHIFDTIQQQPEIKSIIPNDIELKSRFSNEEYIHTVEKIRKNIVEGDIYEMNLCREFYVENISIDPITIFNALCKNSKAPFSVLFKWENKFLISASPERFLKKTGNTIISQPIKGTIKRGNSIVEDETLKDQLLNSEKDRAENVMIVDLVRNDLTKSAETGSIKVDELFGIYSFEHVHQMVSTISAQIKNNMHIVDILKNTFPMGSMTGAPKVMVMQLIEQYEKTKRGVFSGAFGYITPENNFDFNVVIRSILYNETTKYFSASVGGAIVFDSDAEKEAEECLLKLKGIRNILGGK